MGAISVASCPLNALEGDLSCRGTGCFLKISDREPLPVPFIEVNMEVDYQAT